MAKIQIMDQNLANKIAAGEVVERPSSVVKEIVENAIDAGSTKIDILLEEAGIQAIKIIDNGSGMDPEDALMAFERHATSKLLSERDLFRIETLGFRGEALPSIASVSDLTLVTSNGEDAGTLVHLRGGKLIESNRTSARKGTELSINNLFFNTPARLKYLKSINTELGYSVDYVNKIALSHPEIAFRFQHDGRTLLQTNGNGNVLNIISSIYGLDVAKKMQVTNYRDQFMDMTVYLAEPEVYRTTRNYISLVVNERVVKNNDLIKSIVDGYEAYIPIGRYPIVVVNLKIDPLLIDVNVHPAKLEIRFSNQEQLRTIITNLIKHKLRDMRVIPKIQMSEYRKEKDEGTQQTFDFIEKPNTDVHEDMTDPRSFEGMIAEPALDDKNNEYRGNNYTNQNLSIYDSSSFERDKYEPNKFEYSSSKEEIREEEAPFSNNAPVLEEERVDELKQVLPKLYYIGQLSGTYLLAQNDRGLYLIDQHAAEERINYEFYLKKLTRERTEVYELLVPETFEFSMNEVLRIEKHLDQFEALKIGVEKFGTNSFIVTKVPNWFNSNQHREYIEAVFQAILEEKETSNFHLFKDLAATLSCKRSIKANHFIDHREVQTLLDRLTACQDPYRCPHGRPVVIEISYDEIEQMFKRTV